MGDIFRPLLFACSLFGVKYIGKLSFELPFVTHAAYSTFVGLLLISSVFFRISQTSPIFCQQEPVAESVMTVQQLLGTVVLFSIYRQILSVELSDLSESLEEVEQDFGLLNIKMDYRRFKWKIFLETVVIVVCIHVSFALMAIGHAESPLRAIAFELLPSFYPILLINLVLMIFVNLTLFIESKFTAIKAVLSDFREISSDSFHSSSSITVKALKIKPRMFFEEIKRIASIYSRLYCIVNRLNTIFGLSNLTTLAFLGISLTCHLFLTFKLLMENFGDLQPLLTVILGEVFSLICLRNCHNFNLNRKSRFSGCWLWWRRWPT